MTTIEAKDAEELYWGLDGHGEDGGLIDGGTTVGPWTLVGSSQTDEGRWHARYYLVLRDEAGDTWGLRYGIGLTEIQEPDLPWKEFPNNALELVRLYPHEVTRTEYRTDPPA